MSMANAMATSDGVREQGTWPLGARLGGLWPWRPALASARHPRYNSPLTFHSMDDSLSHAA
jgi:hypothetical protein